MERHLCQLVLLFSILGSVLSYTVVPPPPRTSVDEVGQMIRNCFQTLCKEWMTECHWFCDSLKSKRFDRRRCMDCLSWRGQNCLECFNL